HGGQFLPGRVGMERKDDREFLLGSGGNLEVEEELTGCAPVRVFEWQLIGRSFGGDPLSNVAAFERSSPGTQVGVHVGAESESRDFLPVVESESRVHTGHNRRDARDSSKPTLVVEPLPGGVDLYRAERDVERSAEVGRA